MITELRESYNASFRKDRWETLLRAASAEHGPALTTYLADGPVFLPAPLMDRIVTVGARLVDLLRARAASPEDNLVPPAWRFPRPGRTPTFFNIDFALAEGQEGGIEPKVIELQGFPSAYASQVYLADLYRAMLAAEINPGTVFLNGLDQETYRALLGRQILGAYDPEEVALVDIAPREQRNWMEFSLTQRFWGVRPVCITQLVRRGQRLGVEEDGRFRPVRRIYNRVVPEELAARNIALPFLPEDPPRCEWAGHPAWFFRWSKAVLPFLDDPAVPQSLLLSQLKAPPEDLSEWVLKPLFSYGGRGVHLSPTHADLGAIAPTERASWMLMKKIKHARLIAPREGGARHFCEVRLLYVFDEDRAIPVSTMIRVGGDMVAHSSRQGLGSWARTTVAFVANSIPSSTTTTEG